MGKVLIAITVSLDGYIAGPNDGMEHPLGEGGEPLFEWFFTGDTPSKYYDMFRMSQVNADFFDAGVESCGAVVSGRRTYDIAHAWGGNGPVPGLPLFILTHSVPADVPETTVPYTFVTDGVESAIKQAQVAAGDKYVALTGSQATQQALRAGLLDEIQLSLVPMLLGGGVRLFDHIGGPVRLEIVQRAGRTGRDPPQVSSRRALDEASGRPIRGSAPRRRTWGIPVGSAHGVARLAPDNRDRGRDGSRGRDFGCRHRSACGGGCDSAFHRTLHHERAGRDHARSATTSSPV